MHALLPINYNSFLVASNHDGLNNLHPKTASTNYLPYYHAMQVNHFAVVHPYHFYEKTPLRLQSSLQVVPHLQVAQSILLISLSFLLMSESEVSEVLLCPSQLLLLKFFHLNKKTTAVLIDVF